MSTTSQVTTMSGLTSTVEDSKFRLDNGALVSGFSMKRWQRQKQICLLSFQEKIWTDRSEKIVYLIPSCDAPAVNIFVRSTPRCDQTMPKPSKVLEFISECFVGVRHTHRRGICHPVSTVHLHETDPSFSVHDGCKPHAPSDAYLQYAWFPCRPNWSSVKAKVAEVFSAILPYFQRTDIFTSRHSTVTGEFAFLSHHDILVQGQ